MAKELEERGDAPWEELTLDEEQQRALRRYELSLRYEEEAQKRRESYAGRDALFAQAQSFCREVGDLFARTQEEITHGAEENAGEEEPQPFPLKAGSALASYGLARAKREKPLRTVGMQAMSVSPSRYKGYEMPGLDLLLEKDEKLLLTREDLLREAFRVEKALGELSLPCAVVRADSYPRHLGYVLSPGEGVTAQDLKGALPRLRKALSGGRLTVYEEESQLLLLAEREKAEPVYFREMASSSQFLLSREICLALGKGERGEALYVNLSDLPHLLIGGEAQSGKSTCLHSILVSILYHARPQEAQVILADPGGEEFSAFQGIPHLLWPLPGTLEEGVLLLKRCALELELRFEAFSRAGVGTFEKYLALQEEDRREGRNALPVLPRLILVIPEAAPLLRKDREAVSEALLAIARQGEKAGINLILATQEPVYWILSPALRRYIPSRIAFKTQSLVDSSMVLGTGGAQNLAGAGDFLALLPGEKAPLRGQATFCFHREEKQIVSFLARQEKEAGKRERKGR